MRALVQDSYIYGQTACWLKETRKRRKNKERESRRSLNKGLREEEINKTQRETLVRAISGN